MSGRLVGIITATTALIVLWFVALGLYTSLGGLLIAAIIAALAGAAAAALAQPARWRRSAAVVAAYLAMLVVAYVLLTQTSGRDARPESRGGPTVMPPE